MSAAGHRKKILLKVIILGDSGVGKISSIFQFFNFSKKYFICILFFLIFKIVFLSYLLCFKIRDFLGILYYLRIFDLLIECLVF
jgi:hypothetical protein